MKSFPQEPHSDPGHTEKSVSTEANTEAKISQETITHSKQTNWQGVILSSDEVIETR